MQHPSLKQSSCSDISHLPGRELKSMADCGLLPELKLLVLRHSDIFFLPCLGKMAFAGQQSAV